MFRLLHMKARQMSRDYDAMKPASESGEDSEASGDEHLSVTVPSAGPVGDRFRPVFDCQMSSVVHG